MYNFRVNPMECEGKKVFSTEQIAKELQTTVTEIESNFKKCKKYFTEGEDYIMQKGEYLWTEKGAFLHAKSVDTDYAWKMFDAMMDTLFEKKETSSKKVKGTPRLPDGKETPISQDAITAGVQGVKKILESTDKEELARAAVRVVGKALDSFSKS